MDVNIDIGKEDYRAFYFFNFVKRKKPNRPVLLIGFTLIWALWLRPDQDFNIWAFLVEMVVFAGLLYLWMLLLDRFTAWLINRMPENSRPYMTYRGVYQLHLDKDGIELNSNAGPEHLGWDRIQELVDYKAHFFLMKNKLEGLIVPKRCLPSGHVRKQFLDICLQGLGSPTISPA